MDQSSHPSPHQSATAPLRALCIARHCYLSEHFARYFAEMGVATTNTVGIGPQAKAVCGEKPDVVICDYDLLTALPLEEWEHDELLSNTPVVAVSLTRKVDDVDLLDSNGIAGFLYLPTLEEQPALRILRAAATRSRFSLPSGMSAPRTVEHS